MTYFPNLLIQRGWNIKNRNCINYEAHLFDFNEFSLPAHPTFNRGEWVPFTFRGHETYLYEAEYELVKDILDFVEELNIESDKVVGGLSPMFAVFAVLNDRPKPDRCYDTDY